MTIRIVRLLVVLAVLGALLAGCDGGCSCQRESEPEAPVVQPEMIPEPVSSDGLEVIRPDTADVMKSEPIEVETAPAPVEAKADREIEAPPVAVRERTPFKELRKESMVIPVPPPAVVVEEPEPEPEPEEPEVHTIEVVEGPYGLSFARIPEGSFVIGSEEDEIGRDLDEGPAKDVQIAEFWLSQTEVTLRQWKMVMGDLPFRWQSGNAPPSWTLDEPVRYLNWYEAHEFINQLNQKTGHDYRLPTESEWEYACRAWASSRYWSGETESDLRESDWVGPYGILREVQATERHNAFGLFDMHGNVSEWVEDDYFDTYRQLPEDGTAYRHLPRFSMKVTRGGSFLSSPDSSRSASREPMEASTRFSTIGFRVAANQMAGVVLGE